MKKECSVKDVILILFCAALFGNNVYANPVASTKSDPLEVFPIMMGFVLIVFLCVVSALIIKNIKDGNHHDR